MIQPPAQVANVLTTQAFLSQTTLLLRMCVLLSFLQILGRLSEFDGTCLTLLVRGLAAPPPVVDAAFSSLPADRFIVVHFPPYNPSFGFVSDRLLLSWAVRRAEATVFLSTLYTQPFWVREVLARRCVCRGMSRIPRGLLNFHSLCSVCKV